MGWFKRSEEDASEYTLQSWDRRALRIKLANGKVLGTELQTLSSKKATFLVSDVDLHEGQPLKMEFYVPLARKLAWNGTVDRVEQFISPAKASDKTSKRRRKTLRVTASFVNPPEVYVKLVEKGLEQAHERYEEYLDEKGRQSGWKSKLPDLNFHLNLNPKLVRMVVQQLVIVICLAGLFYLFAQTDFARTGSTFRQRQAYKIQAEKASNPYKAFGSADEPGQSSHSSEKPKEEKN